MSRKDMLQYNINMTLSVKVSYLFIPNLGKLEINEEVMYLIIYTSKKTESCQILGRQPKQKIDLVGKPICLVVKHVPGTLKLGGIGS